MYGTMEDEKNRNRGHNQAVCNVTTRDHSSHNNTHTSTRMQTHVQTYSHTHTHTQENGTIMGFPNAEATDENLLIAECDILVPAAGEKQITSDIARNLKAKVILLIN